MGADRVLVPGGYGADLFKHKGQRGPFSLIVFMCVSVICVYAMMGLNTDCCAVYVCGLYTVYEGTHKPYNSLHSLAINGGLLNMVSAIATLC